jgi:hypothetical protein
LYFLDDNISAAYSYKIKVENGWAHQSGKDREKWVYAVSLGRPGKTM